MAETRVSKLLAITEQLVDLPYFVLSPEDQKATIGILRQIFLDLKKSLKNQPPTRTSLKIDKISKLLSLIPINEYRIFLEIKDLVVILDKTDNYKSIHNLKELIDNVIERSKLFWLSEESIARLPDDFDFKTHSRGVLEKEMQLYSLDYFLYMNKELASSKDAQLIFAGKDKLPGLYPDAMADDMLKNVVYSLKEKKLRYQMISDYYQYKKVFLPLDNRQKLSSDQLEKIALALKKYCISLLQALLCYKISEISNGILFPYGNNKGVSEVKDEVENGR